MLLLLVVSLGLWSAGSSLSCRWMEHKYPQYSGDYLGQLDAMAHNCTNCTEDEDAAADDSLFFPTDLYSRASRAAAEEKLALTVQVLQQTAALFQEDHSSASWEENTVENFVNVVTQQADGLQSCIGGRRGNNKKLQMCFKRLLNQVLKKKGHSADAWELIRRQIKDHLMRVDQLLSSLHQ